MKLRMLSAFVILSVAGTVAAAAPQVALVNDGQPACAIVIAKDARKSARFGACELQWHIKKMTGAEIPIVSAAEVVQGIRIYVGESDALKAAAGFSTDGFKTQEYVVSVQPGRIILAGKDSDDKGECTYNMDDPAKMPYYDCPDTWNTTTGSLYAVYDFLERSCGVRWFNQTESGTFIPETKSLSVPCGELRRRPAFIARDVEANPGSYDSDASLWKADAPQFKEWDALAYAGLHEKYRNADQYNAARAILSRLFLLRSRNGGDRILCNHAFYGYYDRFWKKNPNNPAVFVERRPNYFAKGYEHDTGTAQLCYTDPGLIRQVAQDAADHYDGKKSGRDLGIYFLGSNPAQPFPLEPMDSAAFCKCENCARFFKNPKEPEKVFSQGGDSDYWFNFVNEVCKELHKTHPDKGVISLAYMTHARLPSFKLDPGVTIQYCFTTNRIPYDLISYDNELANLAAWAAEKKVSGRQLGLYLYDCFPIGVANGSNPAFHCFPGFFAHTIGRQMKLWHHYGIYGMTYDGYGQEVEAYVSFRLMNDPSLDVDELLDEYFTRLYGNAAEPMKKLYNRIEETYSNPESYSGHFRPRVAFDTMHQTIQMAWGVLGTEERMAEFGGLMESAEKLAQTDMEKHRVALFKKAVWEYMTTGAAQYRR